MGVEKKVKKNLKEIFRNRLSWIELDPPINTINDEMPEDYLIKIYKSMDTNTKRKCKDIV